MKKILIIDDNINMCKAIKRLLDSTQKYQIFEAHNGFEAEQIIKEIHFDLFILDIRMPGKDGYEICFHLKNNMDKKEVKIVAISASGENLDAAFMKALGADCYFDKPFDDEEFKKKIDMLLSTDE